ncbi:MAG: hypothetical protein P9M14_02215 [Candidatus Alcyoniella australis]|nr:hypothetical protein [Candidatus Alcyoniella australis]
MNFRRTQLIGLAAGSTALLATLLLIGCTPDSILIEQTLDLRERALNDRDTALYLSTISDDYNYQGKTKADLERNINERFAFWSKIEFQAWNRQIMLHDDQAVVEQQFTFRLTPKSGGEPVKISDSERIVMCRLGMLWSKQWKIAEGI